jgi:hypothetical protein
MLSRSFLVRYKSLKPSVWDNELRSKVAAFFTDRSVSRGDSANKVLPVAQFVSMIYDLDILPRDKWPTSRIIEDMHSRGYAKDVFTKPSYGAEPPPSLSLEECEKWVAHFRVISLNSIS